MKKLLALIALSVTGIVFSASVAFADVWVNGYYRDNGTFVEGYWRSSPDSDPTNNFSYPGNTNPYTGAVAPGNPNTYLNNYSGNSTERSIKEAQEKLKKDNEALQKSIEASQLKTKLNSLSNQINQLKQQTVTDSCSALYNLHFSNPLTCSDSQYQSILQQKEAAKSRVDSLLFTQGLAGNAEIRATRMAEIDAQYDSQLNSCKSTQNYNSNSMQEYEQCKINQSKTKNELLKLEEQYREAVRATNVTENPSAPKATIYDQYLKEQSYNEICRNLGPHWVYSGNPPVEDEGQLCVCENEYKYDTVAKKCVAEVVQIIPSHEQIMKEINKPKTANTIKKPIETTIKKIEKETIIKSASSSSENNISVETSASSSKPSTYKDPVELEATTLQKIGRWFKKVFSI